MIRPATPADLAAIMQIVRATILLMRQEGSDQWSDHYPAANDFRIDQERGELFVLETAGQVRGVVAINQQEPTEYQGLPWSRSGPALVIHRLAIDPQSRRQGVATALMSFADKLAFTQGLAGLRSDTYSRNPAMNALFAAHGWTPVGTINFPGRTHHFNCFEKATSAIEIDASSATNQ